ncbi:MAG: (Fe-S)-binding protein [Anaerolineales bacterium]|jgi:Fe-S oxidoreductase
MLSILEKISFLILFFFSILIGLYILNRIITIIRRGQGSKEIHLTFKQLLKTSSELITLKPTFNLRKSTSLFHALIAWCFLYYLVVNAVDLAEAFIPDFELIPITVVGNLFRFGTDILSVFAMIGMTALLTRRFIFNTQDISFRDNILLYPGARGKIKRDSAIVGIFILLHVGARFFGQSFRIALIGFDPWQPFASMVANKLIGVAEYHLFNAIHAAFWISFGSIILFVPYFLYSKHIHIFFSPANHLIKPIRRSIGELDKLDFEDESVEQFGASRIEDLGWEQILDSFACIMCNRCQVECPAYETGKELSPAAMEINKRLLLNHEGRQISRGDPSTMKLSEYAITENAIWACTTCGACNQICPVNNEPMRDILDIRRSLVLMENNFPEKLQVVFRSLERNANPWNITPSDRLKWAEGISIETIERNNDPDILWWVGCAPAADEHAQKTARAFLKILKAADINYAVLGELEKCTGDSARRAGNEYLFSEMALENIEILNSISPKQIVTTCPHCLHTIKNEYPSFGGNYRVAHHTEFIENLIRRGELNLKKQTGKITYHDPCYLSRHNKIINPPRHIITAVTDEYIEMQRNKFRSFCCGAGGAQMWKEEEDGAERVSSNRYREAESTNADITTVSCPFCMIMLSDAGHEIKSKMQIMDIAEIIASQL